MSLGKNSFLPAMYLFISVTLRYTGRTLGPPPLPFLNLKKCPDSKERRVQSYHKCSVLNVS